MTGASGKTRTRIARRNVSFSHEVRVNVIQSVDMLSNQQIRKMWCSRDEMASMKMSAKAPLHQQDQQKEECDYGLQSSTESFVRSRIIQHAQDVVLQEQELQWENEFDDHDRIAQLYSESASLSRWEAVERAAYLSKEVQKAEQSSMTTATAAFSPTRRSPQQPRKDKMKFNKKKQPHGECTHGSTKSMNLLPNQSTYKKISERKRRSYPFIFRRRLQRVSP